MVVHGWTHCYIILTKNLFRIFIHSLLKVCKLFAGKDFKLLETLIYS